MSLAAQIQALGLSKKCRILLPGTYYLWRINRPHKVIYSAFSTPDHQLSPLIMKQQQKLLKTLLLLVITTVSSPVFPADADTRGKITGGKLHPPPDWFKDSFLEIADDVDDASEAGKHVLLFFELNGCPYCDRMLSESFETEPLSMRSQ